MDKRTLLAIALSAAVLIIYYGVFYEPPAAPPPAQQAAKETAPTTGTAPSPAIPSSPQAQPVGATLPPEVADEKVAAVVSDMETTLVNAKLSSKSGFPLNWLLKKFYEEADQKGSHIDLLHGTEDVPPIGILLYPGKSAYFPFFSVKEESGREISYQSQIGPLALEQRLTLGDPPYSVQVSLKVTNQSDTPQTLTPGLRLMVPQKEVEEKSGFFSMGQAPAHIYPLYRLGTSIEREQDVKEMGIYQEQVGDISWVGLEDRYFLRAILARSVSAQNKVAYGKKDPYIFSDFQYPMDTLSPQSRKEYQFTLYLGPKDPTYLNAFKSVNLDGAIDLGWFGFVARPILMTMKFFYSFLGNWGLAIILLTVIIKILLHPLTKKSMASMKAMQKLQPQLKEIREKYKEDKERLNQETMSLFRTHKVNPMGGCLPMLIQMPIYIALYKVLYNATELYHAPFFWFYRDLSAPDPYYILPILLGVAMLAQQKMTPSTGDPTQAKMMMIMPIMFTVFMLFLPLGLVLYIFVNTVMTVIQQYMHQHDLTILGLIKGKKT
ncbi:MAG: membrane protein insertase YidC [bacterium]|nr:membrane protein insertase YidC [bacterium]